MIIKRINTDVFLKLEITKGTDSEKEDFTQATDIHLFVYNSGLTTNKKEYPVSIIANIVSFQIAAKDNIELGTFSIILAYQKPNEQSETGFIQYYKDFTNALQIVPTTDKETADDSSITGNVDNLGVAGDNAFEIWKRQYGTDTSTVEDFITYLKEPAIDIANAFTAAESNRVVADNLRTESENQRITNENTRITAENDRLTMAAKMQALIYASLNAYNIITKTVADAIGNLLASYYIVYPSVGTLALAFKIKVIAFPSSLDNSCAFLAISNCTVTSDGQFTASDVGEAKFIVMPLHNAQLAMICTVNIRDYKPRQQEDGEIRTTESGEEIEC